MAGDELSDEKSGDHLRKGTPKFSKLSTPLLDSLILDDLRDVAELLAHSMDSGVVGMGDSLMNADGQYVKMAKNGEG
jgi:hypothetical protein